MTGEKAVRTRDPSVRERRDQILIDMCARETPRVSLILTALFVLFDIVSAFSGARNPFVFVIGPVIQSTAFLLGAWLIWSRTVQPSRAPMVFGTAMTVAIITFDIQYVREPVTNILGVVMVCLVASGALILMWRPFIVVAALSAGITAYAVLRVVTPHAEDWLVSILLAVCVSAVLLWGRYMSATTAAVASLTIEEIATRDPLTGLLNRRGLQLAAPAVTAVAFRRREPLFAIFVDIVGLKKVNDTHGHILGDQVIKQAARAVEATSRDSDIVTRWGGDEFLIVGIGPAPDEDDYLERLHQGLDLSDLEGKWPGLLSIGMAYDDAVDLETLIAIADTAMYNTRAAARVQNPGTTT